jgi:hypothetical protein
MALVDIKVYQVDAVIAGSGGSLTPTSTLEELIEYLQDGMDYPCPQCGETGTIDTDNDDVKDTECPTCSGNEKTEVRKKLDLANSTLVYIDA